MSKSNRPCVLPRGPDHGHSWVGDMMYPTKHKIGQLSSFCSPVRPLPRRGVRPPTHTCPLTSLPGSVGFRAERTQGEGERAQPKLTFSILFTVLPTELLYSGEGRGTHQRGGETVPA